MSLPPQPDLILRCSDGDLRAHSLILSLTSPLLLDLIEFERESQPDKKVSRQLYNFQ